MSQMQIHKVLQAPSTPIPHHVYLLKNNDGVHSGVADQSGQMVWMGNAIRVDGPAFLYHGQEGSFEIQHYDERKTYSISVSEGTLAAENGSFTILVNNLEANSCMLTINGYSVIIPILTVQINQPEITSLFDGETDIQAKDLIVQSSPFGLNWGGDGSTHQSTDWEVATDPTFTNVVFSSLNDSVNLTQITIP